MTEWVGGPVLRFVPLGPKNGVEQDIHSAPDRLGQPTPRGTESKDCANTFFRLRQSGVE